MAKPVRLDDDVHQMAEYQARQEDRSITKLVNRLLREALEGGKGVPEKEAPQKISEANLGTRGSRAVLADINLLEQQIKASTNQDPDYWEYMNEQKQELWNEYHALKAQGL